MSAVLLSAVVIFIAELGDKTMVTTMTLSTQYAWPAVWLGATLAMTASIVLAVLVGRALLRVVPLRVVHLVSAALFAIVGVVLLVG
jgi:putative Ca2+/H+ antiporter (TMEM165/GDT1 family)